MSYILATSLGAAFGAGYWWVIQRTAQEPQPSAITHQTANSGDEVEKTENLLAAIPDPAYRQLVAAVIHASEPKSELSVGTLVDTPDGTRMIDFLIRSQDKSRLVAIDVVNVPTARKAGIEFVDAAESKRADIKADVMILCSNTGFDDGAIAKAKRAKIGLISVLHQGDERVKAVIEEVMYVPKWDLNPFAFTYHGEEGLPKWKLHELKYHGRSVDAWLIWRAMMIASQNPTSSAGRNVTASFKLKKETEFEFGEKSVKLSSLTVTFHPHVKWFAHTVRIDATTGIYDYVRGKVRLPRGEKYIIDGIDFSKGTPLSSPPDMKDVEGGLIPGEINVSLDLFGIPKDLGEYNRTLEAIVIPEDLSLRITSDH